MCDLIRRLWLRFRLALDLVTEHPELNWGYAWQLACTGFFLHEQEERRRRSMPRADNRV